MTPEVTETAPAPEAQSPGEFHLPSDPREFENFMQQARDGMLQYADEGQPAAVVEETPVAEETPAAPVEEIPTEETPVAEDPEKGKQFRLRAKDPRDQAIFAVMKANDLSYKEAEATLFPNQAPAASVPATEEKSQEPVETVESIDAETTRLRKERQEALDSLDFKKVGEIDDLLLFELPQKRADIAGKQAQAAVTADQAAMQAYTQYQEQAAGLYPDAAVPGSALYKEAEAIIDAWQASGNPILGKPESVLRAVQMAANELGIAPKRAGSPVPVTAKTAPARAPAPVRMRPAAGGGNGQGAAPAAAEVSAVLNQVDAMDLDELKNFARRFGR